jgi:hypothetical protein
MMMDACEAVVVAFLRLSHGKSFFKFTTIYARMQTSCAPNSEVGIQTAIIMPPVPALV